MLTRLLETCALLLFLSCCLGGCSNSDSSPVTSDASGLYDENRCGYYLERFSQTADEQWHELYLRDCLDLLIELNMPSGLPAACRDQYADMVRQADQIAFSVSDACAFGELDSVCVSAQVAIDQLSTQFSAACTGEDFYVPAVDLYALSLPPLQNAGGACTSKAWIPPETRLSDQAEEVEIFCPEVPAECTKQIVNDVAQWVETYQAVDGGPVYLPCAEQFVYGFNPCDENQDGLVSPFETRVCSESGEMDPCDFNQDGFVDDFEAGECLFFSAEEFVDTRYVDPCDYNYDGIVDQWENEQCYGTYGCAPDEEMYWDAESNKDVCVNENAVPFCPHPSWPEYLNGQVVCMHPCDMNRDGKVDAWEENNCNFVKCAAVQIPFWDPMQNKDVCVAESAIPHCDFPTWPEYLNGNIVCSDPCDMNRDGNVDWWERDNCTFVSCDAGEVPFFDPMQGREVCHPDPVCEYPTWPELSKGEMVCHHPCDFNFDGEVDDYEWGDCFY